MKPHTELLRIGNTALHWIDERNWGIGVYGEAGDKAKTPGEETFKIATYHRTLCEALTALTRRVTAEGDISTVKGYLDRLQSVWDDVKDFSDPTGSN